MVTRQGRQICLGIHIGRATVVADRHLPHLLWVRDSPFAYTDGSGLLRQPAPGRSAKN